MASTHERIQFLRARYQEEDQAAQAAAWCEDAATWRAAESEYGTPARPGGPRWYVEDAMDDGVITTVDPQASADEGVAQHIAHWDPAHVLRDLAAKRQVLDAWEDIDYDVPDYVIDALAAVYADHPDYPR